WCSLLLFADGGGTRQPRCARGSLFLPRGLSSVRVPATKEPRALARRSQEQEKARAMINPEMGSGAVGYYDRGHLRPERVPDIGE
ncbi:hypothetical protein MTO96_043673, partial [Rhipicephalus appendiculatus]